MSTDLDHFGLWPSALGIATESAGQPTSMMAFDDYNMSPAVWDMPGAAFDAEFESLDHRSGDDAITHPLAPEMWNDFTNLPPGVDFPQLSDQPQLDLTSILDSMYDTNSNMGSLAMLESVPVPSRDLAPTNDEYMLGENIWTSTPAVGVRKGSGQLEPAISVDSAMTASGQASDERQNWPSRVAPFPVANATRSQRFITGRRKSEKGVNNTKQVFRPRLASPIQRSHSTASQNCNVGRSKRGMSTIQSIPSQNHIITAELLWQKDSKVSAKTSEGAFHIFSFADEPVQQRTRKPFSPDRLKEVNIVRSLKACNSCRRAKVAVSDPS